MQIHESIRTWTCRMCGKPSTVTVEDVALEATGFEEVVKESWSLPVSNNPYASPAAGNSVDAPLTDAEAIRTRLLSHEASVKSIGALYMIGAILMVLGGISLGVMLVVGLVGVTDNAGSTPASFFAVLCFFYLGLGILQGATAMGIRKLQNWARYVAVVFSVIGLLGFPIGTIISAYFLYLLLSQKGTRVFSDEYKEIIAATPHIKYKTSIIVIILLILLVVILVFGALALAVANIARHLP
jgi:hypothetical protein